MFDHSGKHGETLAGNNVSATIFPSLPRALRCGLEFIIKTLRWVLLGGFRVGFAGYKVHPISAYLLGMVLQHLVT